MDCTKYRDQVNQFIDGELEMRPQVELFRHLAVCAACQTLIDGLIRIKENVRNERISYPQELDDAILSGILSASPGSTKLRRDISHHSGGWSRQVSAPLHLAASFVIMIIAAGILLGRILFPSADQRQQSAALPPGIAQPQTVIFVYGMPPMEIVGTPTLKTLEGRDRLNH